VLPRILALLLLLATACSSEGSSKDCKDICQTEANCVDQRSAAGKDEDEDEEQNKFDQSECIAACDALSRDEVGKKLVEKHTQCTRAAGKDCAAILQCK
jgi:hypothetical protein